MPDNSQALPGGTTKAADRARRLAIWIGPSIRPADGTLVAKDLLALGAELALGHDTVLRAVAQAHPGTATDLLPELEEQYGLPDGTGLATSARQAIFAAVTLILTVFAAWFGAQWRLARARRPALLRELRERAVRG